MPAIVDTPIAGPEGGAACSLPRIGWHGALSFAGDGPVFAKVLGASTAFVLPQSGTGMIAQVEQDGLRIAAWVHEPRLHLGRSIVLSEIVYPRPAATVDWEGLHRAGAVAVSLDVSSALVEPAVARGEVACKDLSIAEATFKLPASVSPSKKTDVILTGEAPLATKPGGAPIARVQKEPGATLSIVGTKGASTHIVLDDPSFVVHGWIPTASLEPGMSAMRATGGPLVDRDAAITLPNSENHGCVRDLPVFVEHAGRRAELGVLAAGSPYPQLVEKADAAGYVAIKPYGRQWLELATGARLVARADTLAHCRDE